MPTREEKHYELATLEVAENRLVTAIWGKAFSEALGDNQKALALYIKLRVEHLEKEFREAEQIRETEIEREIERVAWAAADRSMRKWGIISLCVIAGLGLIGWLVNSWR